MKNLFTNKIFLSILFFILGGVTVYGAIHLISKNKKQIVGGPRLSQNPEEFFGNFFNNDFFDRSRDPFEEMRRMQKQMTQEFTDMGTLQNPFDNWYQKRFGGGDVEEIKQREDDNFVYYDIDLHGSTPKEFKVDVKDGQVTITAKTENKKEDENDSSYYSSTFRRSFPVPVGVEADQFKMEQEGKKIVLKFPKKKE